MSCYLLRWRALDICGSLIRASTTQDSHTNHKRDLIAEDCCQLKSFHHRDRNKRIEITNEHCPGIAWSRLFVMGFPSAEGQQPDCLK
jgi:hypothetical protein